MYCRCIERYIFQENRVDCLTSELEEELVVVVVGALVWSLLVKCCNLWFSLWMVSCIEAFSAIDDCISSRSRAFSSSKNLARNRICKSKFKHKYTKPISLLCKQLINSLHSVTSMEYLPSVHSIRANWISNTYHRECIHIQYVFTSAVFENHRCFWKQCYQTGQF